MPNKAFFEITNACNLSCSFCHGTRRPIRYLTTEEFTYGARELRGFADYLYYHLMGEPLLHPRLGDFLAIAHEMGFKSILTTNGTLLGDRGDVLLGGAGLHKVSISLHSHEANRMGMGLDAYLDHCFTFAKSAADRGIIAVLRLWNRGGADGLNGEILRRMHDFFDGDGWREIYSGYRMGERLFLEWGERFDWPDTEAALRGGSHTCYGLRDQVGVLSDGTVVPCCLDAEGAVALGNLFTTPLSEILASDRAMRLKQSFQTRHITEALCQRCGYAHGRFGGGNDS